MAWLDDGYWIARTGRADGTGCAADVLGDLAVGPGLAIGDCAHCRPGLLLAGRAVRCQRQIE